MLADPVVIRRATVGYVNYRPAGRFYEARTAAPDVVIGAFPSAHEARKAIFEDRRARQAALRRAAPQHPAGTKPVFRGDRLIGWVSVGSGGFDAVLADGEVHGPFPTEAIARKTINSAWGASRSKLPPVYGLAARRRADLVRLGRHRRERGQEMERCAMALVMADALTFSHIGVDYPAMLEFARTCNILLAEDDIMPAVKRVTAVAKARGRAYRPFAGRAVARMLDVTLAEKKALALHTIAAIDETQEQAKERMRAERREYERQRNKRRRMERGAVPHEESLSRTEPWRAARISRSTWYARRAAECSEKSTTYRTETVVGQIRPPAIQGKSWVTAAAESVQQLGVGREGWTVVDGGGGDGRAPSQTCPRAKTKRFDPRHVGPAYAPDTLVKGTHSPRTPTRSTAFASSPPTSRATNTDPADLDSNPQSPDFHGYHLALYRACQRKSLRLLDSQYAKAHPEIANPAFRDTRVKIYEAHKMRVLKTISDKEFAARVAPWLPSATNADPALGEPKSTSPGPDLLRLRAIVNRLRWERGLRKLSSDGILRLVAPLEEDEDAEEEQQRDWLRGHYGRMDDQLLTDQIGDNEELASRLAGDLEELLDWSEGPRRHLIRSRLINLLVDRELAA
jgi:hypothetical protein